MLNNELRTIWKVIIALSIAGALCALLLFWSGVIAYKQDKEITKQAQQIDNQVQQIESLEKRVVKLEEEPSPSEMRSYYEKYIKEYTTSFIGYLLGIE